MRADCTSGHSLDSAHGAHTHNMPSPNSTTQRDSRNGGGRTGQRPDERSRRHGSPDRQGSSRLANALRDMHDMLTSLSTSGSASDREKKLQDDNFKLRRRNARLLDELEAGGSGAPDGHQLVSDADAADLVAYRAINPKPDELKKVVEEHGSLKAAKGEQDKASVFAEALEAIDTPNVAAGVQLLTREKLHIEFRNERVRNEETGKMESVRVPYARPGGDDKATPVPLDEYLTNELSWALPSLLAEPDDASQHEDDHETSSTGGASRRSLAGNRDRTSDTSSSTSSGSGLSPVGGMVPRPGARSLNGSRRSASASSGVPVAVARGARAPSGSARVPTSDELVRQKLDDGDVDFAL